jgi:ABC-type glucose/galactose transport system permease subunit
MDWSNLLGIASILALSACGIFNSSEQIAAMLPHLKYVVIVVMFLITTIFGVILSMIPGVLTF